MRHKQKSDDSRPSEPRGFDTPCVRKERKIHLTFAESLRQCQLDIAVEEHRSSFYDYMLLRASLSRNYMTKKGWWILYALSNFVEKFERFPHLRELNPFLDIVLGKNEGHLELDLSKLQKMEIREIEAQCRTTLKKQKIALKGGKNNE